MEYKKSRQNAKRVISSAKEKKQKKCANDLNDSEWLRKDQQIASGWPKCLSLSCNNAHNSSMSIVVHESSTEEDKKA